MSAGDDADGPALSDAALALLCALALVLGAAVVPAVNALDVGGLSGLGFSLPGTGSAPNVAGSSAHPLGGAHAASGGPFAGGSPSGMTLSEPPGSTPVGSTSPAGHALSQRPLFLVNDSARYLRETSYAIYTGRGWRRSADWQTTDGAVPGARPAASGRSVAYRVRLLSSATALPTIWRPGRVDVRNGPRALNVSSTGAVESSASLPANTTYVAHSVAPPRDPRTLNAAGTDYPASIRNRYTQLITSTAA